ncbi:hypothetical protein HK101_003647 [Irineochytrium annulatum]|nr:hypothetical protein HK101_003647 [Irineochytrium annulatum]
MEQTKAWLRQVVVRYQNADRTYRDVEAALLAYNGIIPKMDTFTHDNGRSEVLLCLHGTVPISFKGVTYNIPVAVWVPQGYPQHPPMAFVTPTATMVVREGKHVDKAGRVYHPVLAGWHTNSQEVNLVLLLTVLQEIFSLEPPVYSRPASSTPAPTSSYNSSPSIPASQPRPNNTGSLPRSNGGSMMSGGSPPPPIPPNPYLQHQTSNSQLPTFGSSSPSYQPPIPQPPNYAANPILAAQKGPQPLSPSPAAKKPTTASTSSPAANPVADAKEQRAHSLRLAIRERVLAAENARRTKASVDYGRLIAVNKQLNDGDARIGDLVRRLKEEEAKVMKNTEIIQAKNEELKASITRLETEPEVNVDEVLGGGSVVHNQLIDTVAEEHALDDTIYTLSQALNTEALELPLFMKSK